MVSMHNDRFMGVKNRPGLLQVKLKDKGQLDFVLQRPPWVVANFILQLATLQDYQREKKVFQKNFKWFNLHNYPDMYLKMPTIVSITWLILDTKYFDITDLKIIEIY